MSQNMIVTEYDCLLFVMEKARLRFLNESMLLLKCFTLVTCFLSQACSGQCVSNMSAKLGIYSKVHVVA